ncbi:hypothetical protein AYO21_06752 [Fonsecaea monophora]|uniref:Subtilisin-like serine protease protein n=1 Tax=Fonsecaea monophora TaxID=254056 RepID=A0A177F6H2_9EURO|nr:hypothetical protein AYO21_06752 [Fonsecaea monophora]KAH0829765.1 hypothetical protein FOPE_10549 [Fonsecaea pedrosoi]OAG39032.1 hypothetical protein AYO21_06752 [Fonsecaea monophora]
MNRTPFAHEDELYHQLYITSDQRSVQRRPKAIASASQNGSTTIDTTTEKTYLPGQPYIGLGDPRIGSYLESELVTRDLNKLAPHLWLVAKQDSSHISSLTHQIVRGRQIIITEKPELHLVWIYNRVYIKPIPRYLLSHAFWKFYLIDKHSPVPEPLRQDITRAALGFLRSYRYLVQHKSDFVLATDDKVRLLPKGTRHSDFIRFIRRFEQMTDTDVSPRYEFGELRLTRLNFWTKIFLRRYTYQKVHGQYGAYFAQFYGPILFVFGVFSVALSAMQVGLAIQPFVKVGPSWTVFAEVSRWFAISTLLCVALIVLFLIAILASLSGRETVFAIKDRILKATPMPLEDAEARMPVGQ